MNDEPRISTCALISGVCWATTSLLLFCGWFAWALNDQTHLAILIAETACIMCGIAIVAQVRCYAARVATQIRLLRLEVHASQPLQQEGSTLRRL